MTGNLNMGSNTVTSLKAPSAASDASTKAYTDSLHNTNQASITSL